jgi:hypothetical protein
MSQLEDEIRESTRSEAERLREVRPLRLSPAAAHHWLRRAPSAPVRTGSACGRPRRWPRP